VKKLTKREMVELAVKYDLDVHVVDAIKQVESSGNGFDWRTGKIMIQFEPHWFKKLADNPKAGQVWRNNKVEPQSGEWAAFNDAWKINPEAAMLSTSIGLMQVMGFNHKVVGFLDVGKMWDFAKESEANQLELELRFMVKAVGKHKINTKNFEEIARIYNGPAYKKFNYDTRMKSAYDRSVKDAELVRLMKEVAGD